MTDLEIIKENAHRLYDLESYEPYEVDRDAIIEAASRMAARIEELEKIINLCDHCEKEIPTCNAGPQDITWGHGKGNDNVIKCSAFREGKGMISRLVDKLSQRPEIVRCGECVRNGSLNCSTVQFKDGKWQKLTTDDFYCAIGVRKAKGEE